VLDPDSKIWNLYQNHWWPRKLLVNVAGEIVYDHIGEGGYEKTETAIQNALREGGAKSLPVVREVEGDEMGNVCLPVTAETYLGYERGVLANRMEVEKNHFLNYKKRSMKNLPSLEGEWKVTREYVESGGGILRLPYSAGEVNAVMETVHDAKKTTVVVTRAVGTGRDLSASSTPIPRSDAGNDIRFDGDATVVDVAGSRMYNIVLSSEHNDGKLTLEVPKGVRIYAFTFGGAC